MSVLNKLFDNKSKPALTKLHVGCGSVYFSDWINLDIDSKIADKKHDMRKQLPYDDNSMNFIYNEHFIEHISVNEGLRILTDFHRVLKPEGVLRIATPDLDYLIEKYQSPDWKDQDWISESNWQRIQTNAEMLNLCFREWEHQYLYNEKELKRRLKEAGFGEIIRKEWHISDYSELSERETRKDSKLILEAIK